MRLLVELMPRACSPASHGMRCTVLGYARPKLGTRSSCSCWNVCERVVPFYSHVHTQLSGSPPRIMTWPPPSGCTSIPPTKSPFFIAIPCE